MKQLLVVLLVAFLFSLLVASHAFFVQVHPELENQPAFLPVGFG